MNKLKLIIRSTIGNIFFYPGMAIGLSIMIAIGLFSREKMRSAWDYYIQPFICGIEIEVRGKEYIKPGYIFASKHESALETYAYTGIIKNSVFVLKKELTYVPIFGWGQALYGMIPVDRGAGAKAMKGMLKTAKERIKEGRNLVIFPEGTRCKHLQVKGYKSGIVFLAEGLGLPVVPVALNTDLCWSKSSFIRRPGKVIFEFLPPIDVKDYKNKKEFIDELQNRIETACQRIA